MVNPVVINENLPFFLLVLEVLLVGDISELMY